MFDSDNYLASAILPVFILTMNMTGLGQQLWSEQLENERDQPNDWRVKEAFVQKRSGQKSHGIPAFQNALR